MQDIPNNRPLGRRRTIRVIKIPRQEDEHTAHLLKINGWVEHPSYFSSSKLESSPSISAYKLTVTQHKMLVRPLLQFIVVYLLSLLVCYYRHIISVHEPPFRFRYTMDHPPIELSHDRVEQLHVIILMHGIMGNHMEMDYLKQALEREAGQIKESNVDNHENWQVLVFSARSNAGKTFDGIANGGLRLAQEVNTIVQELNQLKEGHSGRSELDISLSIVAHSLGGLYARHALKHIDMSSVTPKVFCTTVTPHLGTKEHTWIPIPRGLEVIAGKVMQQTGEDLFRMNNLLDDMVTHPEYLDPLGSFELRVAIANAFGTDFQVPTASAAFLSSTQSRHVPISHLNDPEWVTLRVETPRRPLIPIVNMEGEEETTHLPEEVHAERLDSLGWSKVFVDMRPNLWSLAPVSSSSDHITSSSKSTLESKDVWHSHELKEALGNIDMAFPWGHSLMIANHKNPFYRWLNEAGKPVMDHLAQNLLSELLKPSSPDDEWLIVNREEASSEESTRQTSSKDGNIARQEDRGILDSERPAAIQQEAGA